MTIERKTIHFEGVCPFLMCMQGGPHDHPICPECGTVGYGSLYGCATCRGPEGTAYREAQYREAVAEITAYKAARERS